MSHRNKFRILFACITERLCLCSSGVCAVHWMKIVCVRRSCVFTIRHSRIRRKSIQSNRRIQLHWEWLCHPIINNWQELAACQAHQEIVSSTLHHIFNSIYASFDMLLLPSVPFPFWPKINLFCVDLCGKYKSEKQHKKNQTQKHETLFKHTKCITKP